MESPKEVSEAIAKSGYIINVNLPSWKSPDTKTQEQIDAELQRKRRNQIIIAVSVLAVIVIGIFMIRKSK